MTHVDCTPNSADQALLLSYKAHGDADFFRSSKRFSQAWRDRLRQAWCVSEPTEQKAAWGELYNGHVASARHDPSRVHPSWFARALKNESPSIRLSVVSHSPTPLRQFLCRELQINPQDLSPDRAPDSEALSWAMALWSERLVGDVAERRDDPAVIVALTRCNSFEVGRLIKVCGLVKHAFAVDHLRPSESDELIARFTPLDRVRFGYFRRHIGKADPRLKPLARSDMSVIDGDRRRGHSLLGLVTFGRLLAASEQHRARWAVQHIPYPVAKRMRIRDTQAIPLKSLLIWESWVLDAAWSRLLNERRLSRNQEPVSGHSVRETA